MSLLIAQPILLLMWMLQGWAGIISMDSRGGSAEHLPLPCDKAVDSAIPLSAHAKIFTADLVATAGRGLRRKGYIGISLHSHVARECNSQTIKQRFHAFQS